MTDNFKMSITDALQFVKVSTTHNGEPSNIQSSGHLTALSCEMLLVELERHGYRVIPGQCTQTEK